MWEFKGVLLNPYAIKFPSDNIKMTQQQLGTENQKGGIRPHNLFNHSYLDH